ncbi:MAG TPA: ABC transporter permease [Anaeromyxobacter sp.]|nr:ABC transporter permease [Anaeromyxobacter sp.]
MIREESELTVPTPALRDRVREFQGLGPLVALVVLAVLLSVTTSSFLTVPNLMNVLQQSSVTLIMALGMTVVIVSAGIDLSVGSILALSGCTAALLARAGVAPAWCMLAALGVGAGCGIVSGLTIALTRIPDFIMTLGMLSALRGLALILTRGLPVTGLPRELTFLGAARIGGVLPVSVAVAAVMTVLVWFVLNYTATGRCAFAVGGNREAARASGINLTKHTTAVYALSGLLAGVASIVTLGRINSANALMGQGAELSVIAVVIIGGTNLFGGQGSISGTVLGALIFGVISNGLNLRNVTAFWQQLFIGVLIVLVAIMNQFRHRS